MCSNPGFTNPLPSPTISVAKERCIHFHEGTREKNDLIMQLRFSSGDVKSHTENAERSFAPYRCYCAPPLRNDGRSTFAAELRSKVARMFRSYAINK